MIEIQKGLYLQIKSNYVNGKTYTLSFLKSADGYCFYNKNEEIYDEDGNVIVNPTSKRLQYMTKDVTAITDINKLNNIYVSVPIEDGFEIG